MNIFALDTDPQQAAQWLCDRHVTKMIVESSQLLANCFSLERLAQKDCPRTQKRLPRKHFNPKHPSSLWTLESQGNFKWLLSHVREMLKEKYFRYPNNGRHFCHDFVDWVAKNIDDSFVECGKLTKFKIAINESMNCRKDPRFNIDNPVLCYRLYYKLDKPFVTWKRNKPQWFELK